MEEKSSTISNNGKRKLVKNKNNLTDQKSKKKEGKEDSGFTKNNRN